MAEEETPKNPEQQPSFLRRGEDFESLYANHVHFQASEWDLRLTFGELDYDKDGKLFIEQHTAITVPWLQAKLMSYFLTLQLGVFEMTHGKIPIPIALMPPAPDPSTLQADNSLAAQNVFDYIKKTREEFLGSQ